MTTRLVAGHRIRELDGRCDECGKSVNDVMSVAVTAKVGDYYVACRGILNSDEMEQIQAEQLRRERAWADLVGVVAA